MNFQIQFPIRIHQGIAISARAYELQINDMILQQQISIRFSNTICAIYICYALWLRQLHRRIQTQVHTQGA